MEEMRESRVVTLVVDGTAWAGEFGEAWTPQEARADFRSYVDEVVSAYALRPGFGSLANAEGQVEVLAAWAVCWAEENQSRMVWCDGLPAAEVVAAGLRKLGLECDVVADARPGPR